MSYWVRPVAVASALAAHVALIVSFSVTISPASTMPTPIEKATRVNFTVAPPPQPVKQEPPKVKQLKPQQIVEKPKPKPQLKKVEIVKSKPKPVLAKVEAKKEKLLSESKEKPVPPVTQIKPKSIASKSMAAVAVPVIPFESPMDLERQKQRYLAKLLAHIDAHKHYPRAAQRRGIEGDIMVSFLLLADGSVQDIRVKGDNKLLRKAAQKAVYKAMPLPLPNKNHSDTTPIEYTMAFRLVD